MSAPWLQVHWKKLNSVTGLRLLYFQNTVNTNHKAQKQIFNIFLYINKISLCITDMRLCCKMFPSSNAFSFYSYNYAQNIDIIPGSILYILHKFINIYYLSSKRWFSILQPLSATSGESQSPLFVLISSWLPTFSSHQVLYFCLQHHGP